MISIIICSRNQTISSALHKNIAETIGVPYEIVCIDNSKGEYSMCSAYNEGVRRAKGEYLCFMHEDVSFLSKDWGKICTRHFSDPDVGMIAILGCTYLDECMPYWWDCPFAVGHNWCGNWHKVFNEDLKVQNVVAADGLWLMIKRELFDGLISWDEDTFHSFDMYDFDISMQMWKNSKKIVVDPEICIDHTSNGNQSFNFYQAVQLFHNKWDYMLPISANDDLKATKLSRQYALKVICRLNNENNSYRNRNMKWENSKFFRLLKLFKSKIKSCCPIVVRHRVK